MIPYLPQPLDADLTAITALSTTAYGRSLLTLANQAALQTAVDVIAALEAVASDIPTSDPNATDRIWLDGGIFRFTGTTGSVGDLFVGTSFVS